MARTPASGQYDLRVRFDKVDVPQMEPIVVRGIGNHVQTIAAYVTPHNRVQFCSSPRAIPTTRASRAGRRPGSAARRQGFQLGDEAPFVSGPVEHARWSRWTRTTARERRVQWFHGVCLRRLPAEDAAARVVRVPHQHVEFGTNNVVGPIDKTLHGTLTMHRDPRPPICKYLSLPRIRERRAARHQSHR